MAYSSNGATLEFDETKITEVVSITPTINGAEIDITTLGGSAKLFEAGLPDITVTAECVGVPTITVASTGSLSFTESGGTPTPLTPLFAHFETTIKTGVDNAVTSTIVFKPTADAVA